MYNKMKPLLRSQNQVHSIVARGHCKTKNKKLFKSASSKKIDKIYKKKKMIQ